MSQLFIHLLWRPFLGVGLNLGEQICCVVSDKISFEVSSPIWCYVNDNEEQNDKIPKFEISAILYNFDRYPP